MSFKISRQILPVKMKTIFSILMSKLGLMGKCKNLVIISKLTKFVNVRVENFCSEQNLGWNHGVIIRKEEFSSEQSSVIWSITWASNLHVEVTGVVLAWFGIDSDNYNL